MKGMLRVALLSCSWAPLQRWLLVIGMSLAAAGHLAGHFAPSTSPLAVVGLLLGLALIVFPAWLINGIMFRSISAPRTLGLIPRARLKMLFGLAVCLAIWTGFVTASIASLKLWERPLLLIHPDLTQIFVGTLALGTVLFLGMFFLSTLRYGMFVPIAVVGISQALSPRLSVISLMNAAGDFVKWTAFLTVAAWLAFAVWYLRVRRIAQPLWAGLSEAGADPALSASETDVSRESALAHLLGLPSMRRLAWSSFWSFSVFLVVIVVTFLRSQPLMPNLAAVFVFMGLFSIFFLTILMAIGVTRRSRLLWIGSGCTRRELFRICERLAWRCLAAIAVPILLLCAGAWVVLPHQATHWPYLLVAASVPIVGGLYLGLMNVAGWRLMDVTAAIFLIAAGLAGIVPHLFFNAPLAPVLVSMPMMLLVATPGLRWWVERRWRRIDWLICKPPRLPSQALRPMA